jgi:aerobic-type carbon monoxide dehydrogenase small subunit (CoxS/CutS family)
MTISLTVNGSLRSCDVASSTVLADVLRDTMGLQGCKIACDQGVCGACTVLVDGHPVAACSSFAFASDGCSVTTVEGLARNGVLHAVQDAFLESSAFQCGFCTSGMILSIVALLRSHPEPDDDTIRDWLGGNVCRCTGYGAIVEAVRRSIPAHAEEHA